VVEESARRIQVEGDVFLAHLTLQRPADWWKECADRKKKNSCDSQPLLGIIGL